MAMLVLLLAVIIGGLLFFAVLYNRLVSLKLQFTNAWAQIEVQLKRRYDLIPNLVEVAKGYMAHEKQTLENVIKARTQATQAVSIKDKAQAENLITSSLRSLFAVAENYPNLKADQTMLKLQEELTTTENRISFARQYYNDQVMLYNTAVKSIPTNFVAQLANFKETESFEIEDVAQRQAPSVKF